MTYKAISRKKGPVYIYYFNLQLIPVAARIGRGSATARLLALPGRMA